MNWLRKRIEWRRLFREYVAVKAKNDRVFWALHDSAAEDEDWKSPIRYAINVTRPMPPFVRERALWDELQQLRPMRDSRFNRLVQEAMAVL